MDMDMGFYKSSLSTIAIVLCVAAIIHIHHQQKHYSLILTGIGFVIVMFSKIAINYCIGIALYTDSFSESPLFCNNVTPYIKDIGYIMIAIGLYKFSEHLKNA